MTVFTRKEVYGMDPVQAHRIANDIDKILAFLPDCVDQERTERVREFARHLAMLGLDDA